MNDRQPRESEEARAAGQPVEHGEDPGPGPRIYVASLSDYNAGRLHGAWLDAAQGIDELQAGISAMLVSSQEPGAEEWAIHDYDGFGPLRLGEYESLERLAKLGQGIAGHGEAFAAWASITEADLEDTEAFEAGFRGRWDSVESYAGELLADLGVDQALEQLPDWLQPYISVEVAGFARDLELASDLCSVEASDGGVFIFEAET